MAFKYSPLFRYTVYENSMNPTFTAGDTVWVNRVRYNFKKPHVGDVIVFKHPNKNINLIKRIKNITEEKLYVLGDNSLISIDSRNFGPIKNQQIIGKVIYLR